MTRQKLLPTLILAAAPLFAWSKVPPSHFQAQAPWTEQWIDFGSEGYCSHSKQMKKRAGDTARTMELMPDSTRQSLIHCSIKSVTVPYRFKIGQTLVVETTYADFWIHVNASRVSVWNYLGMTTIKNEKKDPADIVVLKPTQMLPVEREPQRLMAATRFEMGEPIRGWKRSFQDLFRAEVHGINQRKTAAPESEKEEVAETGSAPGAPSTSGATAKKKSGLQSLDDRPDAAVAEPAGPRLRLFDPHRAVTAPIDEETGRRDQIRTKIKGRSY